MNKYRKKIVSFFPLIFLVLLYPMELLGKYNSYLDHGKSNIERKITIERYKIIKALGFFNELLSEPLQISKNKNFLFRARSVCSINDTKDLEKIAEAKKRSLRNDLGLKFKAGIRRSTGNLNLYNNSAFAGVSWDLVKDGFLENRLKSEEISVEQSLIAKDKILSRRKLLSLYRQNYVTYYFARLKIPILKKKIKVLHELMRVKREGYFYGIELADSLVKIEREIEKVKAELRQYEELIYTYCALEKFNFCKYYSDELPPVLSIRFPRVIEELIRSEVSKQEDNFKKGKKIIELKHDWRHNLKLGAYLYYNTKGDSSFFSKQGFVTGLNLTYPLGRNYDDVDRLKLIQKQNDLIKERSYLEEYANLLFREEEEKVSDAVKIWYGMDIAFERMRRESYKLKRELKEGNVLYRDYVAFIENIKEYLDGEFEFVSSEGLLYRRIVNLLTITGVRWENKSRNVSLTPLGNRFRVGRRYVILKQREVKSFPKDFIADLLYTKGVKAVVMEKNLFDSKKGRELRRSLSSIGIKSYLLDGTGNAKQKKVPLCLSTKDLNATMGNWHCIIYEGITDKHGLEKLLKRTNVLFVPRKDLILKSDKLGVFIDLKHTKSELELEKRLDKLYQAGIKNFLFDFNELMNIYSGGFR